jgi:hypothetical protein
MPEWLKILTIIILLLSIIAVLVYGSFKIWNKLNRKDDM